MRVSRYRNGRCHNCLSKFLLLLLISPKICCVWTPNFGEQSLITVRFALRIFTTFCYLFVVTFPLLIEFDTRGEKRYDKDATSYSVNALMYTGDYPTSLKHFL